MSDFLQARPGYQAYLSFTAGFGTQAEIVSTSRTFHPTTIVYAVTFMSGSRVDFHVALDAYFMVDGQGHTILTSGLLKDFFVRGPGGLEFASFNTPFGANVGNPFAPGFMSAALSNPNSIEAHLVSTDQIIHGYGGRDSIIGGAGHDIIVGGIEADEVIGNPGNDTFVFAAGDVQANEIVHGRFSFGGTLPAGEVNTLQVYGSADFRGATITNMNRIVFNEASTLTFSGYRFGPDVSGFERFGFQSNTAVVGDAGANALVVDMSAAGSLPYESTLDMRAFSFANWIPGQDTVRIVGGPISNVIYGPEEVGATLVGSLVHDDILRGGRGNDTFVPGGGIDTHILAGLGGRDIAQFEVASGASWRARNADGSWSVVTEGRIVSAEGSSTLTNIELLQFTDRAVRLREDPTRSFFGGSDADILWRHADGSLVVWNQSPAAPATTIATTNLGNPGPQWRVDGAGDFGGDGSADILFRNTATGAVAIWSMVAGHYVGGTHLGVVGWEWQIRGAGDFDSDGDQDILWRHADGTVVIWDIQNGSYVGSRSFGVVGPEWQVAGTGDFNADGPADILWRNTSTGGVVIWTMAGGTVVGSTAPGAAGLEWHIQKAGDFDGDGDADILWRNAESRQVLIWTIEAGGYAGQSNLGAVTADWTIVEARDFKGDGDADILWRQNTGRTDLRSMENAQIHSAATVTTVGAVSTDWQVVG